MLDDARHEIDPDVFRNLPPLPAVGMHLEDADLSANARRFLQEELSDVSFSDLHATWARFFMPVHGTTVDRALQILEDGAIFAHSRLDVEHPEIHQKRIFNATDALDIEIGMDRYVFTSVGRVNPFDIQDIYLCFTSALGEKEGSFVALREIVHFGALVSPEAARWKELAVAPETIDIANRNRRATAEFLQNIFQYDDFTNDVFPRFLARHFGEQIGKYCVDLFYPETEPELQIVGNDATISNAWDGPQLCVPDSIDLGSQQPSILITSKDPLVLEQVRSSGFPSERIFTVSETLETYEEQFGLDYSSQRDTYAVINLALRDMALIGRNNIEGETFEESMNGYKQRVFS